MPKSSLGLTTLLRRLGLGFCAVSACCVSLVAASAQQLNPEQLQQIERTASSICNTAKAQGQISRAEVKADISASLGGWIKIIPVEGKAGVEGSASRESYEGLSHDAAAAANEGDRGCREHVFIKMFDWTSGEATRAGEAARATRPPPAPTAPPVTASMECVVTNPSGRPMNVRETPNGEIKDIVSNGRHIKSLRLASAADGKPWAYVADDSGRAIGWMFFPYLNCSGPGIR